MSAGLDHARLAVLVHEVRSPVAALSAISEAVDGSPGDGFSRSELVRLALAACRAIERIVVDAAVASVRVEPLDVGKLVRDVVAAHVVRGADVVARTDTHLVVDGDSVRLRQAVDNLIANALSHSAGRVAVQATRSEETIRIAVADRGAGVPEDERERIFELGVRLADDRLGSGIGLALARAIAEAHRGSLHVESEPGKGATFTIVLPPG